MIIEETELIHYGILRRSGRYPWGSGQDENTRNAIFLQELNRLKKEGLTEKQIATGWDCSILELRAANSIAKNQQRQANIAMAQRLQDKGYSNVAIGQRMGVGESTVRTWLAPGAKDKADALTTTANMLKDQVAEKKMIDVGTGVENQIGVSSTMLSTAVAMLREDGYELHPLPIPQLGTGKDTKAKILCLPGTTQREVFDNRANIQQIKKFSETGGRSFYGLHPPIQINPDRIAVKYGKDGGGDLDGVIYVRPGVKDIELGAAKYAQVRVSVGKDNFLKGMAMYKEDLPDGVDLMFHTSKEDSGNKLDVMKPTKEDQDNPFGAIVRQIVDNPGTPQEKVTSAMNKIYEEGDWSTWSRTLSPQMLSKQSRTLAKSQLDMTYERRQKEYESILKLTNPTVRKKLLDDFADSTDSAAVHLKAAALPRQGSHVILPVTSLPVTQVYARNFIDGERVVLIRYPHGGTFEIPELIVNNNHRESNRLLGDSRDAIGIHPDVAARLSGADFDGDTVIVIPNNQSRIKTSPALEGLKNFDPQSSYPKYDGMKVMKNTQTEMGMISNLITDMSLQGAPHAELVRAVKHSMVVIDAEKHELNYKLSYNDNNIKQLKEKYQLQPSGSQGAATLISRAKARVYVPERKPRPQSEGGPIDKVTGERVYVPTGRVNAKKGVPRLERTTRLAEARDARTLSSGTPMEGLYADYSNKLKTMANQARLASLNTPPLKYSSSARKTYADQVKTLNASLSLAVSNRPLERQAQLLANAEVRAKRDADPTMVPEDVKKIKFQALEKARLRTGAKKQDIVISPDEWDAIQAGAISDSKLTQILNKADMDTVRKLATPHDDTLMTSSMSKRATTMLNSGYTRAEVAQQLGVSVSTLDKAT